jgi:hypothetical protein
MIVLLLFIVIFIVGSAASLFWVFRLLKPYLKSTDGRKQVLKAFVILCILSVGGAFLGKYLMSEPAYFEQGIAQLHTSKYIKERIGGFRSYSFRESLLSKEPRSPAIFQVEILGDSLNLYLTCTMAQTKGKWYLIKINEDSVKLSQ